MEFSPEFKNYYNAYRRYKQLIYIALSKLKPNEKCTKVSTNKNKATQEVVKNKIGLTNFSNEIFFNYDDFIHYYYYYYLATVQILK